MIPSIRIEHLVDEVGVHDAGLVVLVAGWKKPAGEISDILFPDKLRQVTMLLESWKLSYRVQMGVGVHYAFPEDVAVEVERLEAKGYVLEVGRNGGAQVPIRVQGVVERVVFATGNPGVYDKNEPLSNGVLLGFPACCIEKYGPDSGARYTRQLGERFSRRGLEGIEHLIGIHHVPCQIDCKATRVLGYAIFLKRQARLLYDKLERCLIVQAKSVT